MIPSLLKERVDFRRFWTGQTISLFGDQISEIAFPLLAVIVLHANAAQMGYLTATMLAPNLLFSLHFGALVDRVGKRRRTMIIADLGRALLLFTIPVAHFLGLISFAQLLIVGFLAGSLSVLFHVSYSSVFVSIVPRKQYVEANQLINGSRAFSFLTGTSVGGTLVQFLTAPVAILADAISFVISALFLGRMRAAEPPPEPRSPGALLAGLRFIRRTPLLFASLGSTATINLFNFAFFALFILYATTVLQVSPVLIGLVMGTGAIGSLLGSVTTGRLVRRIGIGPVFVLGSFLFPAPIILVPLAGGAMPVILALLFLAEFGSGFGVMMLDITAGTIQQAIVPDRLRARVSGAYMVVNYGVRPVGSLIGGALGAWLGLRPALWIATVGAVLGVLFLLPSPAPRLRDLPESAGSEEAPQTSTDSQG